MSRIVALITISLLTFAAARAAEIAPVEVKARPGHALTAQDLDAFLDGFVPPMIERNDVAGAVVAVVKDGKVLFEKGYGVSDVDKQTPVDPGTTMFRPGSVSKLFTWTAVMQLYEQKKLDLDADVNTYLDFKIPPFDGKPVTLHNLMTHTPGFEETDKGLFVTDPKQMVPLEAALKRNIPARVFPPGEVPAYSNFGAALAGYIVQRVSGEPFELYIAHHIFAPLGMNHSTFLQPLPAALKPFMSSGYEKASEKAQPFEMIPASPAGALSATADDMTHFMLAHLNNGTYNGAQILSPETAIKMHGVAYQHTPNIPPMAWGFYHEDQYGHTIVGHGGDTLWFHSDLHLILDQNVGLFVSQNSRGGERGVIRGALLKAFMERYFPAAPLPAEPTLKSAKADGALVAGNYMASRGSFTNILSIAGLFGQAKASVDKDGYLSVDAVTNAAGVAKKFHEIAPFIWREKNGRGLLIAKTNNGQVTEIAFDSIPQVIAFTRAPWWKAQSLNLLLIIAMLGMLALTVIFWPVKAILRWRYNSRFDLIDRSAMLYRATRLVALCDLAFFLGFALFFSFALNNHLELLSTSYDWVLRLIQLVGLIGTIGVILPLWNAVTAFSDARRTWWNKLTDVLVAAACVLSAWYAISEHLLTLNLNY